MMTIILTEKMIQDNLIGLDWRNIKQQRKINVTEALRTFVKFTNFQYVTMPQKGKGSNIKIANVGIHINLSEIRFTISRHNAYAVDTFKVPLWSLREIALDDTNHLIIINQVLAIGYVP